MNVALSKTVQNERIGVFLIRTPVCVQLIDIIKPPMVVNSTIGGCFFVVRFSLDFVQKSRISSLLEGRNVKRRLRRKKRIDNKHKNNIHKKTCDRPIMIMFYLTHVLKKIIYGFNDSLLAYNQLILHIFFSVVCPRIKTIYPH